MQKGYLVLGNGQCFEGTLIGDIKDSIGELVFTTGMVGYLETLTDPSYAGQIVMQTFPLIGNYGVIEEDFEGVCAVKGYIAKEISQTPSNFRCQYELEEFLKNNHVVGLIGVDTRQITRIIREEGVMNAGIFTKKPDSLEEIQNYLVTGVVKQVSTKKVETYPAIGEKKYSIALMDYGAKANIIRCLQKRGCEVTRYPESTKAEEILNGKYDGVMLSNGPGDPKENVECVKEIKKLIGNIPVFGICLGHQLTALAMGGDTMKLHYGHRGANQPVKDKISNRTYITTQNHGYAVITKSLEGIGDEIFINANDGSCEGMSYPNKKCFTVQFHPEAASGPKDTEFLFDKFIDLIGGKEYAKR